MELIGNLQIVCPIRGQLKVNKRSKNELSATEEFYRVEAINYTEYRYKAVNQGKRYRLSRAQKASQPYSSGIKIIGPSAFAEQMGLLFLQYGNHFDMRMI